MTDLIKNYLAKLFLSIKKLNKTDQEHFIIFGCLYYLLGIIFSLFYLIIEMPIIVPIGCLLVGHQLLIYDSFFYINLIPKIINFGKEIKEKAKNLENQEKTNIQESIRSNSPEAKEFWERIDKIANSNPDYIKKETKKHINKLNQKPKND